MKVLLADDEPVALARLQLALACVPDAELVGVARNGREALERIQSLKPEVVVLDVQMPGKDGLDVAAALANDDAAPQIIFVTAFDRYAVSAFDAQAVDFLLKPVAFSRFQEAMARAQKRLDMRTSDRRFAEVRLLLEGLRKDAPAHTEDIWVHERGELARLPVAKIDRVEAEGDYVRLHVGDMSYLLKETITDIAARLGASAFLRVHRSTIVNLARVRSLRRRRPRGVVLVLTNGAAIAVGPSYVKEVAQRVQAQRWRSH